MDKDRKLAIAVATVIGIGFAAVVGLSLLGRGETAEPPPVVRARVPEPTAPLVQPVSVPRPITVTRPEPVSAGTPEEAAEFQVEQGANYLARAIEAHQERNFDHAVAYLFAEIDERPDRPYSNYLLGLSLWKTGRLDEAVDFMTRSGELDGTAVRPLVNLSRIQNDRGDFEAALEAAQRALDLDRSDPTALFLEGRSLHNLGEHDEAAESLRRSLEIDPEDGYVWNLLGLSFLIQDSEVEALEAFERASSLEGEVAYIQNNLGMALERNGRRSDAVAAYRRAVELDADHERAVVNLARLEPTALPADEPEPVGVVAIMETPDGDTP